jgi:hypothetical protein
LKAVAEWGVGGEGEGRVFEGVEQTKVKLTHSEHALRYPLNVNSNINNENQDCKTGSVCAAGE